ncbi:MAG: nucleoside triphosphate pyrophosphohydrolase [Clostridiales bacterium]|nr:nucleoside triphosphate pyrophosphohydrolase [Oscillospiraceae bacterium]PWL92244.1 MAG: nucleoside triphosphate pyrophosphohydrolase [Clostridiales bacterium]
MVHFTRKEHYNLDDFRQVIEILRHPGGCPWDQEQTHASIRRNLLEEAYEAAEAIDTENPDLLREELGDVLMQVLFHASIEADGGRFDLDDVADEAVKKLIFRHPHVFGTVEVENSDQVLVNWDQLKRQEKHQERYTDTLDAVARSLPALWRAEKVQKKAAKAGFEWKNQSDYLDKLREEQGEVEAALKGDGDLFEELGDLLFITVNLARFTGVDPEDALNAATEKFIRRFGRVEDQAQAQGRDMAELPLETLVAFWKRAKESGVPCRNAQRRSDDE